MIDRTKLEMILDGLLKETESGRYAQVGPNDSFNDGVYALQEALDEAGLLSDSVEYEYGVRVKLSEEAHGPDKFVISPTPSEEVALSYGDDERPNITPVRRVKTEWTEF